VKIQVQIFLAVTLFSFVVEWKHFTGSCCYHNITQYHNPEDLDLNLHPEDEGSMDLRNLGILPQHYTASKHRKPPLQKGEARVMQIGGIFYAIKFKLFWELYNFIPLFCKWPI